MTLGFDIIAQDRDTLGLIVLQSDETIEGDMRRLIPADLDLLVSRLPSGTEVSAQSLQRMSAVLTDAASLFPAPSRFAVMGYGCTSGTAQIGINRVEGLVRAGTRTDAVTQPVSALIAACAALGVSRIGLISPYVAEVSGRVIAVLADQGITVARFASFDEPDEGRVARIAPASICDAARDLARSEVCDAVFLSCTNLRTLDVVDKVEASTGKPVLSSNQVLAWHMLRLAGRPAHAGIPGHLGRL